MMEPQSTPSPRTTPETAKYDADAASPQAAAVKSGSGGGTSVAASAMALIQAAAAAAAASQNNAPFNNAATAADPETPSSGMGFSPLLQDLALQQQMLQIKHQQIIQQQFLEQQFQRNKEMLQQEHDRQLSMLVAKQVGVSTILLQVAPLYYYGTSSFAKKSRSTLTAN